MNPSDVKIESYEQKVEKAIKEQPFDMEKQMISEGHHVFCAAHAPNESIMFLLDPADDQIKILTFLRPRPHFWQRFAIAIGYLFAKWFPYNGDWNMFIFNKEDAEGLIAFLKKVQ